MAERGVLIVGSGKRVREAALPALRHMEGRFAVRRLFARTRKRIEVGGQGYEVAPLEELAHGDLAGVDLVYVAVAKDAVPQVLGRLASLAVRAIDLLIDTPVVRFKHFHHAARARAFRHAWVAEDCVELPWIQAALAAVGPLRRVELERSAYAYHGVATAKALLGAVRVRSARRLPLGAGGAERLLRFPLGGVARIVEPRDYSVGRLVFAGQGGTLSDRPAPGERHLALELELEGGAVRALRAGRTRIPFDADEADLTRGDPEGASVTARMEAMKRVGFLRLLRRIDQGRGGYPLYQALEDMVVDYHLEKLSRYVSNPVTSPRRWLGRAILSTLSRFGGG